MNKLLKNDLTSVFGGVNFFIIKDAEGDVCLAQTYGEGGYHTIGLPTLKPVDYLPNTSIQLTDDC